MDPVDETEDVDDRFEIPREDLSDPVQSVEPPQTTSHAAAGEETGSAGLRMRMEEGLTQGGYRYRTRSQTGTREASGAVGQIHPVANPEEGRSVLLVKWRL